MIRKKCKSCGEKVERKFHYCPWCGDSFRKRSEDYGMLGLNDDVDQRKINPLEAIGGPLGGVLSQLSKQLTRELQKMDFGEGSTPKGFEIRFSTKNPQKDPVRKVAKKTTSLVGDKVDQKELERRRKLPIVPAESKVRRLPEGIVYEIDAPGVKSKEDVSISSLEGSLEIKAYSWDVCYLKNIPIQVESLKYTVRSGKVLVQIDN